LLERFDILNFEYGNSAEVSPFAALTALADSVRLAEDRTQWIELRSGSRRTGRMTPISGFCGEATYEGDLSPFLSWLLWGQCIQIGKDTTKGNGMYEVS
jgi:hypothetical protein